MEEAGLVRAAGHAGSLEIRSASRFGFLGVWMRRLVLRLTRFQWNHQQEYNRGVIAALREQGEDLRQVANHLGAVSRSVEVLVGESLPALGHQLGAVSRTVEALVGESLPALGNQLGAVSRTVEALVGESLPAIGAQVGEVSRTVEALVGESLPALGNQLGAVSRTVEAVVGESLPAVGTQLGEVSGTLQRLVEQDVPSLGGHLGLVSRTLEQLQQDHGTLYETARAQGRHLDEMASRLGDFGDTLAEAAEREEGFEARVAGETGTLAAAVAAFEERLRPNLHFDSFDFARRHRGSEEELKRRMAKYAVLFGPVARVLDVGCGRGEFLEACREAGVGAYGVEMDPEMVSRCRMKALEVVAGDAIEHLRSLPPRSLDGLFSAQVVEHFTNSEIVELVRLAGEKLRRGAMLIVETINPDTFSALRWFWMDPTHQQPVSPATLRFLLEDNGFTLHDVLYQSPVPEEEALQRISESGAEAPLVDTIRGYNRNVEKLNRILFGDQDYAVVAER